jgi:CRISPR-associated endonuclease Cas1
MSFDALRWCAALRIGVLVIGADGPSVASVPQHADDPRIRRQQALAPSQPVGMAIGRYLLRAALSGRQSEHLDEIEAAGSLEELREVEKHAAHTFWGRWKTVPRFQGAVPPSWERFAGRTSLATGRNRGADRPLNAVLNYLFAILQGEAILACHAVGLDPGLGVLHTDKRYLPGMAFDLMEPVRPEVERFVIGLCDRTWRRRDFLELPNGICRVRAPFTHELAETAPMWAELVAPHAEEVLHMLGRAMRGKFEPTTKLTHRHLSQRKL